MKHFGLLYSFVPDQGNLSVKYLILVIDKATKAMVW